MKNLMAIRFGLLTMFLASVALAQQVNPDSDPASLLNVLWASWGNWPLVVGALVALVINAWRKFEPELWDSIPARWRPLLPLVSAMLLAFSAALLAGNDFSQAIKAMIGAWFTSVVASDIIRMITGKPPTATPPLKEE